MGRLLRSPKTSVAIGEHSVFSLSDAHIDLWRSIILHHWLRIYASALEPSNAPASVLGVYSYCLRGVSVMIPCLSYIQGYLGLGLG